MDQFLSQEKEPIPALIWWVIGIPFVISVGLLIFVGWSLLSFANRLPPPFTHSQ